METTLKIGELVVMKTNWRIVYTLIDIEGSNGVCLASDNERKLIPLVALEKYDAVRAFGL